MMRRLLISLALLAPMTATAAVNLAAAPIGRTELPWWRERFAMTRQQAREHPNARLVWLGDSITQYWQRGGPASYEKVLPVWQHYYGRYHPLDFGFIGDTTSSLIWRLDHGQVAGLHPRLVIILIGANNLGATHWGARRTVPGIEAVVNNVHRRLPRAKILLLGILPSIRSPWISRQTGIINAQLQHIYAHSRIVTFRNVGWVLMKDGRPDPSLYVDPRLHPPQPALHPDAEGMARIARALAPTVAALMR
ncbi:MAG TPA: GDSL-type esterase/lipase family protein [Acetobacteraceae bacterium]|nr:GDSL-type esterase/lipase family protein [Acetobacteraceae bacterium]